MNLSNSKGELSSCQCFTTFYGEKKGNRETCVANSLIVADYVRRFAQGHWSFLGPGPEMTWYETHVYKPSGEWDNGADVVMIFISGSGHPVFRVILRTVISVNQLSVCGAVADLCGELAWEMSKCSKGTKKPTAPDNLETKVMPPEVSTTGQTSPAFARVQGNLLRQCEQKFADIPEHFQLTKLCSNAGLAKTAAKGQYFTALDDTQLDRLKGSCREYFLPRSDRSSQVK